MTETARNIGTELDRQVALVRFLTKENTQLKTKYENLRILMKRLVESFHSLLNSPAVTDPLIMLSTMNWVTDKTELLKQCKKSLTENTMLSFRANILLAQRDFILAEVVRSKLPKATKKEFDEQLTNLQDAYNQSLEKELSANEKIIFQRT